MFTSAAKGNYVIMTMARIVPVIVYISLDGMKIILTGNLPIPARTGLPAKTFEMPVK